MPGFRGPLFVLGLGATAQQAGFRSPLPVPPIGVESTGQAGFRNPLPVPPIGGEGAIQAGYIGPVPLVNLGATGAVVDPVPKFKGGGGGIGPIRKGKSGPVANIRQREEQEILALIAAFVEILE